MQEIQFKVQGSAAEPYEVVFIKRSENTLSAYCSCPAGETGKHCKHRFNIIDGSLKGIVSDNLADVQIIQDWVVGTDVEKALTYMRKLESEAERIKKELSEAKKIVARAMLT